MTWLQNLRLRMRGVQVVALVGKSGTGKSFRARLVAQKENIDLMIDDGLLIRGQKILAGKSAKREKNYLAAVRTALFTDPDHLKQVSEALKREHFKGILIIGTSDRMVQKIAKTLGLPAISRIIRIEDIATSDEIATAMHMRHTQGRHVIPVPAIEVRNNNSGFVAESLKVFFRKGAGLFRRREVYEKAVVRPEFARKGSISISEAALGQMILHCVDEFGVNAAVKKVKARNDSGGYRLKLELEVPYGEEIISPVHELQSYIIDSIERFTGILIHELHISIESVRERNRNAHDQDKRSGYRKRRSDGLGNSQYRQNVQRIEEDTVDDETGLIDPRNDGKPLPDETPLATPSHGRSRQGKRR